MSTTAWADNISFIQIDVPGASSTGANGINDAGQIVGGFGSRTGGSHSFLYSGGSFAQIDVPGAVGTGANGINNAGQIVGIFGNSTGGDHGFLYSGGSFTQIDVPGALGTFAYGINDAGQIVGGFYDGTGTHGLLYSGGNFTQIDVPGATSAYGMNDAGPLVGVVYPGEHGFLYSGGSFTQIDVPGASGTLPSGINDAGQIVGFFQNSAGGHGFVATVIPEPATRLLLCIGFITIIGLGLMRCRVTAPPCENDPRERWSGIDGPFQGWRSTFGIGCVSLHRIPACSAKAKQIELSHCKKEPLC